MSNLARAGAAALALGPFSHSKYLVRPPSNYGPELSGLVGTRGFEVSPADGAPVMYVEPSPIRGEWSIFDGPRTSPLVRFKARERPFNSATEADLFKPRDPNITLDCTCDVFDAQTGAHLGVLRSKREPTRWTKWGESWGERREWEILDTNDHPIGRLQKEGWTGWRSLFVNRWHADLRGVRVFGLKSGFASSPVLDLATAHGETETRFALACGLFILCVREQRKGLGEALRA